ncbi:MAG TPA: hypothetical protein VH500_02405 [Nitrososphaeraceae archaeon]
MHQILFTTSSVYATERNNHNSGDSGVIGGSQNNNDNDNGGNGQKSGTYCGQPAIKCCGDYAPFSFK